MAAVQSPQHLSFGRALRELCETRGISQEELAFRAGLHRNYVGSCECREINLSFRVILQLAAGLQVSFGEIAQLYERIEAAGTSAALAA
ncbi:MAG TPA: helix-turn-helix transcriptional regulator [Solirubrobacterales bacterium]|nr:helix-turn-helix transcriptional regulator [Solirubrobacterales bacterium]